MAKNKSQYQCTECGSVFPKWQGQCTDCNSWNTLVESAVSAAPPKHSRFAALAAQSTSVIKLADIQAQVLELNTLSQDLFGDLSGDVNEAAANADDLDSDALLASMQICCPCQQEVI